MPEVQHTVKLLHNTPLYIAANGARTCWDSGDKSDTCLHEHLEYDESMITGEYYKCKSCGKEFDSIDASFHDIQCGSKDADLIDRVGNKFKHASILEHLTYNFYIEGISRACLQELARHRMASPSVKSTRYTLKELKEEPWIFNTSPAGRDPHWSIVKKYCVLTGNQIVDDATAEALGWLQYALKENVSNDIAKYCLPESYRTTVQWTINARSLQNFISLRSDKSALWEIRQLANSIFNAIPADHKYLFEDHLKGDE